MVRLALHMPEIPPNTGNAIRLAANTGAELHLIRPLGFSLDERAVRRAGLDYRDLADVVVHDDTAAFAAWTGAARARVFAFVPDAPTRHTDVGYRDSDVLLFGSESLGLPAEVAGAPWVTGLVGLPMRPSNRSLNLANAAAVAVYEAWRQLGFTGAAPAQSSSSPPPTSPPSAVPPPRIR
ncbi:tRNA (cytidine(34)-2'-O)-methyltransferase [Pseudonocardia sp. HH130630-07]|uniref:tRNA (cytidine(34)-2'-O)-methyltransferase n=1 Tax=Pseudonocardia sp. HH130630-07 TaxID=1690815 RepID=UPI00081521A5|nr:tRNA (cytidine(34)-2'-O)-methyltransferase [Pseudonocardia sp. HH130630-07]ANY08398.1 RNA methyltransferase [Pseudonocardia sp. HH130630-07]